MSLCQERDRCVETPVYVLLLLLMWINRTLDDCAMKEYSAAQLRVGKPLHMPTEWVLVVRNSRQRWGVPLPVLGAVRQQSSGEPDPHLSHGQRDPEQ